MLTTNAPYGCQTYKDLLILLQSMTPEQLDCTPTVYDADNDEYYPFSTFLTASDTNSVLDEDHPYFSFWWLTPMISLKTPNLLLKKLATLISGMKCSVMKKNQDPLWMTTTEPNYDDWWKLQQQLIRSQLQLTKGHCHSWRTCPLNPKHLRVLSHRIINYPSG